MTVSGIDNMVSTSDATHRASLDAMAHALTPLVRLYLKAGLGAGEFIVAVKLAFIRVAAENARIGRRVNFSVISAVTGLTRKEVRTLVELVSQEAALPTRDVSRQRTARVVHGWKTDPNFLAASGEPAALPMTGTDLSFASLVRRYGGDVPPMSVLKELERAGAVTRSKSRVVRLRKQSIRMKGYGGDVLAEISARVHDLAATMVGNIERAERQIYTGFQDIDSLPAESATLFHSIFSERAATLLDGVDRWIATQQKLRKPTQPGDKRTRVGMGVYLIEEPAGTDRTQHRRAPLLRRRSRKSPTAGS
jgi:hypothetical protein